MNLALRTPTLYVGAATLLALSTFAPLVPAQSTSYKSTQGYILTAPTGFRKLPYGAPVDVMFVHSGGASLNVIVNPASSAPLEQVRSQALKLMPRMMSKFKVLKQGSTTVGNARALTVASTFQSGTPPIPLRLLSVIAVHGGKNYTFSCVSRASTYARYEPLFKKSLASVRWTK